MARPVHQVVEDLLVQRGDAALQRADEGELGVGVHPVRQQTGDVLDLVRVRIEFGVKVRVRVRVGFGFGFGLRLRIGLSLELGLGLGLRFGLGLRLRFGIGLGAAWCTWLATLERTTLRGTTPGGVVACSFWKPKIAAMR